MAYSLTNTDFTITKTLKDSIEHLLPICSLLEEAAQTFTNLLFEEFEVSIALIRFFAIFPFKVLPLPFHKSVMELADARGISALITDDTPILTLLGTRGGENFRNTRTFVGIPLASKEFMTSLPYVPDAQHARNTNGDPLLSVMDRTITYNLSHPGDIKTIFGFGGEYINGPFIARIVFSTEALDQRTAEFFMPLTNYFKITTLKLVSDGKFFT